MKDLVHGLNLTDNKVSWYQKKDKHLSKKFRGGYLCQNNPKRVNMAKGSAITEKYILYHISAYK